MAGGIRLQYEMLSICAFLINEMGLTNVFSIYIRNNIYKFYRYKQLA